VATSLKDSTLPLDRTARAERIKLVIVIAAAVVMGILVVGHVGWTNGPWYWKWPWRRLGFWPLYPLAAVAAAPFFVGQWLFARKGWKPTGILPLLMLTTFAMMLVTSFCQPYGVRRIAAIVENTSITSYYFAASRLVALEAQGIDTRDWLAIFPEFMGDFPVHARFKPPGLILYFAMFIHALGDNVTAQMVSGIGIGLLGACAVPATYLIVRSLADDESAAFAAASCMALCPSLILFFPQFDQVYPTIACLLVWLWWRALRTARLKYGVAFGGVLWLGTTMSYIVLVIGALLVAMTLLHVAARRWGGFVTAMTQTLATIATVVALYAICWATTGFDPIATYRTAYALQNLDLVAIRRPFPVHIVFDMYDFALGTGYVSVALAAMYVIRARGTFLRWSRHDPGTRLAFLAIFQIALFGLGAFLPGEAARLWLILMPLLAAVAGLELARWSYRARMTVYGCLLLLMIVICQNIILINLGENLTGKQIGVPDEKGNVAHE
jgi:hypothetical protein